MPLPMGFIFCPSSEDDADDLNSNVPVDSSLQRTPKLPLAPRIDRSPAVVVPPPILGSLLTPQTEKKVLRLLHVNGIGVVHGPSGSGKSTALISLARSLGYLVSNVSPTAEHVVRAIASGSRPSLMTQHRPLYVIDPLPHFFPTFKQRRELFDALKFFQGSPPFILVVDGQVPRELEWCVNRVQVHGVKKRVAKRLGISVDDDISSALAARKFGSGASSKSIDLGFHHLCGRILHNKKEHDVLDTVSRLQQDLHSATAVLHGNILNYLQSLHEYCELSETLSALNCLSSFDDNTHFLSVLAFLALRGPTKSSKWAALQSAKVPCPRKKFHFDRPGNWVAYEISNVPPITHSFHDLNPIVDSEFVPDRWHGLV